MVKRCAYCKSIATVDCNEDSYFVECNNYDCALSGRIAKSAEEAERFWDEMNTQIEAGRSSFKWFVVLFITTLLSMVRIMGYFSTKKRQ